MRRSDLPIKWENEMKLSNFSGELNESLAANEQRGEKIVGPGVPPMIEDVKAFTRDNCLHEEVQGLRVQTSRTVDVDTLVTGALARFDRLVELADTDEINSVTQLV